MIELDFNEPVTDEQGLIDELSYSCAVYNVECCGMDWDGIKLLFPDNGYLMEERYKAENGVNE